MAELSNITPVLISNAQLSSPRSRITTHEAGGLNSQLCNIFLDSDSEDDITKDGYDTYNTYNTLSNHSIVVDNLDKPLENIQEEENLIQYTDNHFNNRIINDLGRLHNQGDILKDNYLRNLDSNLKDNYIYSNSPISGSLNGSREGSLSGDSDDNNYGKLSIHQVQKNLEKYYDIGISNKFSSEIDILTTYIKGQKNLYIQAKYLTHRKLNWLMFPSLFLTAAITIIAPFIECQRWSGGFISGLNACIALLLSLINYLKLESSTEMYLLMANHYDKLETSLEMTNSKLIFIEHDEDKRKLVLNKIHEVELKLNELKESNSLLIPEEIKQIFPIICHINIFLFIKKMEVYKKGLLIKFRDVKNEIRYILHRWKGRELFSYFESQRTISDKIHTLLEHHVSVSSENNSVNMKKTNVTQSGVLLDNPGEIMQSDINTSVNEFHVKNTTESIEFLKEKHRLSYLYDLKERLKSEILEHRSAYYSMDELFTREIKMAETKKNMFGLWRPYSTKNIKGINPIIDKYFEFILGDSV